MFVSDIPPPPYSTSEVVVVGRSNMLMWEAGTPFGYTMILGKTADGSIRPYFQTYMAADSPTPPLGSRCIIRHSESPLEQRVGGMETTPELSGEVIGSFDCEPPPAQERQIRDSREGSLESSTASATIVARGTAPGAASGLYWTRVLLLIEQEDGVIAPAYATYFGADEPLPAVGSRCTFSLSRQVVSSSVGGFDVIDHWTPNQIGRFDCDRSSVLSAGEPWGAP